MFSLPFLYWELTFLLSSSLRSMKIKDAEDKYMSRMEQGKRKREGETFSVRKIKRNSLFEVNF